MVDKSDKSALLSQLTIDKSTDIEPESHWLLPTATGLMGTVFGALIAYYYLSATNSEPSFPPVAESKASEQSSYKSSIESRSAIPEPSTTVKAVEKVLDASGYISARRMATVSSEIMGLIASVDVEEGMSVDKGQVLAQLNADIAKVDLETAQAQVEVQRARLNQLNSELQEAKRVFERVSSLKDGSYSSEAQLTRAETDLKSLQANYASAAADLNVSKLRAVRLEENLERHTIRAPFAGVVTVKNAQPGEIIAPAAAGGGFTRTGVCTIVDMDSLEIEVDVNEAFINRVKPNQKVIANLDAYPDWDIPASVIAVIPTAIRAKATVQVRIKLEVKDPRILPDMGIKVAFLK